MAIHEDLIYFLKNGRFENINFGITREQLVELIGEPEDWQNSKSKYKAGFYVYNSFEFYFEDYTKDARLTSIKTVNYPTSYARKGNLVFRSYNWTASLTIEKAFKFLNKHKINFEKKSHSIDEGIFCWLETES